MKKEIWKDIPGYEKLYQASSIGRVRGIEGRVTHSTIHGKRKWRELILKQKVSADGNHRVSLWKEKEESTWLVHRLIALTFIPLVKGKEHINHIDGDRYNNTVENLEWCNQFENNNHAFDNDLIKTGNKVILEDVNTGEILKFRSMTKASDYLGKHHNFIMKMVRKNQTRVGKYEIYVSRRN